MRKATTTKKNVIKLRKPRTKISKRMNVEKGKNHPRDLYNFLYYLIFEKCGFSKRYAINNNNASNNKSHKNKNTEVLEK